MEGVLEYFTKEQTATCPCMLLAATVGKNANCHLTVSAW